MPNCQVCGKEVSEDKLKTLDVTMMKGPFIVIGGHARCLENVNISVVIPNKQRIDAYLKEQEKGT